MTSTDYLHFAESFFKDCVELSRKKTADYTGNGADAFANFRQIPENWTEIGFLTRMGDKMARLRSFVQNGDLQVKDESATDTLRDLANYCCLFAAYLGGESKVKKVLSTGTFFIKLYKSPTHTRWYADEPGKGTVYEVYENDLRYHSVFRSFDRCSIDKDCCTILYDPSKNITCNSIIARIKSTERFMITIPFNGKIFEMQEFDSEHLIVSEGEHKGLKYRKSDCEVIYNPATNP